jgi:uncharacterized membrane protein YphA (DoxX/SURF4 family)
MQDLTLPLLPHLLLRGAVAAVWLYEGLWSKLLGRSPRQQLVVSQVPRFSPRLAHRFLLALGIAETLLALWVLSGYLPGLCALAQTLLLVTLNANGLLWARHIIHDPAGMVLKNFAFLALAWVCGTSFHS